DGAEDGRVIRRDGCVELCGRTLICGSQPLCIEDRQMQRGAHAVSAAATFDELIEPDRLNADEGLQVDVRIERRPCRLTRGGSGFDSGACRKNVGTAAEQ